MMEDVVPPAGHFRGWREEVLVVRGSVVVALSALLMVVVYVCTVSLLGADTAMEPAFLFGESMTEQDPLAVHRYLGVTAIVIALAHIGYVGLRALQGNRDRKTGRRRWDKRRGRQPQTSASAGSELLPDGVLDRAQQTAASRGPLPPGLELLELNQELDLLGVDGFEGDCQRGVLVHRDAGHLVVRIIDDGMPVPWRPGDSITAYFWRAQDSGYVFQSQVIEKRQIGSHYLVLKAPRHVEAKQRRVYVRANHRERVRFLHVPLGNATQWIGGGDGGSSTCIFEGMTEDISAGGFRMVTHAPLRPGDYISIDHFSPAGGEILVRVTAQLDSDPTAEFRRFGVQYVGIDSATRDRITREVFRLHREMLVARAQATVGDGSTSN